MDLALNASEARWIAYIERNVAPRIGARSAALVAWWALKEGVLDLPNPWRHSICGGGNAPTGDLGTCPGGQAWQVGMSGIQPRAVSLAQVEGMAAQLYPGQSIPAILKDIASQAGVDGTTAAQIENSSGDLRKAWLLRDPAISFALQAPFVERGCLSGSYSWCSGGWDTARKFASSPARVREVVGALESRFQASSSVIRRNWKPLAAVALLGGAYYLYFTGSGARARRSLERRAGHLVGA